MKCSFIILFMALQLAAYAKSFYNFDVANKQAYQNVISGKLPEANTQIAELKKQQKENLVPLFLEDYSGFINIFLTENEATFPAYVKRNEAIAQQLENGDASSPYHLYCLAEVYLHRAFAQFIFEEYWSGFWNMRKAYLLLVENKKKFPSFIASEKDIALINALTGILPSGYHWSLNIMGIKPDLAGGMSALKKLTEKTTIDNFIFRDETILMYGSLLFHSGIDKNDAIQLYQKNGFPKKDNLISYLTYINILLHSNQNKLCAEIIDEVPQTVQHIKVPVLQYYIGLTYLQQLNPDAVKYLTAYITETKSKHFIKSAYHKMAWSYLIHRNEKLYKESLGKVLVNGNTVREPDKQAEKEAKSNEMPNTELLKSRLLFDGGYYEQSIFLLNNISSASLIIEKDKVELIYRKARVNDAMGEKGTAIPLYKETITKGEKLPYYFAANAALQLGYIYEKENNKSEAKKYFNKCLSLKEHEYVNSLSQKAKAALERLN